AHRTSTHRNAAAGCKHFGGHRSAPGPPCPVASPAKGHTVHPRNLTTPWPVVRRILGDDQLVVESFDGHLADDVILRLLVGAIDDLALLLEGEHGRRRRRAVRAGVELALIDREVVETPFCAVFSQPSS